MRHSPRIEPACAPQRRALLLAALLLTGALAALWGAPPAAAEDPRPATLSESAQARADRADEVCAGRELGTRVFEVRYKPLADTAALVGHLLSSCGSYRVPRALGVIVVEDEGESLARVEKALEQWDLPPASVEVTVSLVLATRDARGEAGIRGELREVSEALSEVMRYTSYERIGSSTLRVMEGSEAEAELGERFRIVFRVASIDRTQGIIHLDPFDLLRMPHPREAAAGIETPQILLANSALNLVDGRLSLVGAPSRSRERALFLALQAWVSESDPTLPEEAR